MGHTCSWTSVFDYCFKLAWLSIAVSDVSVVRWLDWIWIHVVWRVGFVLTVGLLDSDRILIATFRGCVSSSSFFGYVGSTFEQVWCHAGFGMISIGIVAQFFVNLLLNSV